MLLLLSWTYSVLNCLWRDVMSVSVCLSTFHKKQQLYTTETLSEYLKIWIIDWGPWYLNTILVCCSDHHLCNYKSEIIWTASRIFQFNLKVVPIAVPFFFIFVYRMVPTWWTKPYLSSTRTSGRSTSTVPRFSTACAPISTGRAIDRCYNIVTCK